MMKVCFDNRRSCAALSNEGFCTILTDTDFGERKCPFYKTKNRCKKESENCKSRLQNLGLDDHYKKKYAKYKSRM